MHKTRLALAAVLALAPLAALAQAQSDWTFTGNAGLFSDYRFRGISQTHEKPAFQGGFDLGHSSGFYLGNWNSNIDSSFFSGSNLEMDFYGGYKTSLGGFGVDVGVLHYYYPGSQPKIDNTEVYLGGSYGPLSLKYYHAVSDFFSFPDSKNSYYLDLSASYDLGNGFAVNGHVGFQKLKGGARVVEIGSTALEDSIVDYKLGASYTLSSGFALGAAIVGTNRDLANGANPNRPNRNLSDDTIVLSLSKTF